MTISRDIGFLFSRNRLNVAVSRARCLFHLDCSPLQEADEIRIAEAAAVFAHIRVLADGLGLVLEPETAPPAD